MKRIAKDPKAAKAIKKTVGSLPVYYGDAAKPIMAGGFKIKPSAKKWMAKGVKNSTSKCKLKT